VVRAFLTKEENGGRSYRVDVCMMGKGNEVVEDGDENIYRQEFGGDDSVSEGHAIGTQFPRCPSIQTSGICTTKAITNSLMSSSPSLWLFI